MTCTCLCEEEQSDDDTVLALGASEQSPVKRDSLIEENQPLKGRLLRADTCPACKCREITALATTYTMMYKKKVITEQNLPFFS